MEQEPPKFRSVETIDDDEYYTPTTLWPHLSALGINNRVTIIEYVNQGYVKPNIVVKEGTGAKSIMLFKLKDAYWQFKKATEYARSNKNIVLVKHLMDAERTSKEEIK